MARFAVEGLRRSIEAHLVDACRITRQEGEPTVDDTTGALVFADAPIEVFAGPCLLDQMSDARKKLAGFDAEVEAFDVVLPMSAVGVRAGDVLVMTTSTDPDLLGCSFQLSGRFGAGTNAPTRRCTAVRIGPAKPTVLD